jgi:hypothetical protein
MAVVGQSCDEGVRRLKIPHPKTQFGAWALHLLQPVNSGVRAEPEEAAHVTKD